jgi:hypothetical protein
MIDWAIQLARDPIWQFVGIIIAIVAIWVTIWVFKRQKARKILGYNVETNVSLLSIHDEAKQKFEIRFGGRTVGNALLFIVKFFNAGNSPIERQDFDSPLSISFGEGCHILSCDVTHKSPSDLNVEFSQAGGESVILKPMLLNENETFTLKMTAIDYDPQAFLVSARIVGGDLQDLRERPGSLLKPFGIFIGVFAFLAWGVPYIGEAFQATAVAGVINRYSIYLDLAWSFVVAIVVALLFYASRKLPP